MKNWFLVSSFWFSVNQKRETINQKPIFATRYD